jgi:hypothetical protein
MSKEIFKKFHGRESTGYYEIELGSMKSLTELGKVFAIEYKAKKHKDRKVHVYRHRFKKMPVLLTNGKELIIYGEFEIKPEGITG